MKIVSATHRGLIREINEDRLLGRVFGEAIALLAVADGLGGHEAGEHAAQAAVTILETLDIEAPDIERSLVQLVRTANRVILEASIRNLSFKGMGTTLTAALLRAGTAYWAHVGDSRLYLFRQGLLLQITEDQTPLAILVRRGDLTKEEARRHPLRNLITSCLGREKYEIESGALELRTDDMLLLTTDGLHGSISEADLVALLKQNLSLDAKVEALIEAALSAGGQDNITVVAADI